MSDGQLLVPEEPATPLDESEIEPESIKKRPTAPANGRVGTEPGSQPGDNQ